MFLKKIFIAFFITFNNAIKNVRIFLDKKVTKTIKDRILRDIKNFLSMKKKKKIIINQ